MEDSPAALRSRLPAGLLDSGFASISTFLVGVYAARIFDPALLGLYALHFSIFVTASASVTQLLLLPSEIWAISQRNPPQTQLLLATARIAALPALGTGLLVALGSVLVTAAVGGSPVLGLWLTTSACSIVSPFQDHVRRVLHLSKLSWAAAFTSISHAVFVLIALILIPQTHIPISWIPFGILTFANLVSICIAWLAIRVSGRPMYATGVQLTRKTLIVSGRWLLLAGLAPTLIAVVSAALVGRLAGLAALGYAEAARIVSQPLFVFATGVAAVTGPHSVRAAAQRSEFQATKVARLFKIVYIIVGLGYLGLVAFAGNYNPFAEITPTAYVVSGLVALSVFATILTGLSFPERSELMGAQCERAIAKVELFGNAIRLLPALSAHLLRSYALPLGLVLLALFRLGRYRKNLKSYYLEHRSA